MKLINYLYSYLKEFPLYLGLILGINILLTGLNLAFPYIEGEVINSFVHKLSGPSLSILLLLLLAGHLLSIGLGYLVNLLGVQLNMKVNFQMIMDLKGYLEKVDYQTFSTFDEGYLASRISSDTNVLYQFVMTNLLQVLIQTLLGLVVFIIMWSKAKILVLILLLGISLKTWLFIAYKPKIERARGQVIEKEDWYFSKYLSSFRSLLKTKVDGSFFRDRVKLKGYFNHLFVSQVEDSKVNLSYGALGAILDLGQQLVSLVLLGKLVLENKLLIGDLLALTHYQAMVYESIQGYFQFFTEYIQAKTSMVRINELYAIPSEVNGIISLDEIKRVDVLDLSFRYQTHSKDLLKNFSMELEKGRVYGLVGKNGRGKTTLIYLLLGILQDGRQGKILYNGLDIGDLDLYQLRKEKISLVLQGDLSRDEDFIKGDKDWEILDLEECRPKYSGGEKQKLAIVEGINKGGDFFIFDEPSSALDQGSKEAFMDWVGKNKEDKIILIISHDQDLTRLYDRIYTIGE